MCKVNGDLEAEPGSQDGFPSEVTPIIVQGQSLQAVVESPHFSLGLEVGMLPQKLSLRSKNGKSLMPDRSPESRSCMGTKCQ
jgi:hypothetical protein